MTENEKTFVLGSIMVLVLGWVFLFGAFLKTSAKICVHEIRIDNVKEDVDILQKHEWERR